MLANLQDIKQAYLVNLDDLVLPNAINNYGLGIASVQSESAYSLDSGVEKLKNKVFKIKAKRSKSLGSSLLNMSATSKTSDNELQFLALEVESFENSVKNDSVETPSLDNSLMALENDAQMARYCLSLGYKTDNCKRWAARVGKTMFDGDKQIDKLDEVVAPAQ